MSVLKIKDFRFFLFARVFLTLGAQMQAVIVGWQVYDLTHNVLALGLIGLTEAIPSLTISLYGGHLADRKQRRSIVLFCQTGVFLAYLWLMTLSLPFFASHLKDSVWMIYVAVFISGLMRGLFVPSITAMIGTLVPRKFYGRSVAWVSSMWELSTLLGPALAGFLYAFYGASFTYGVAMSLVLFSIFWMLKVKPIQMISKGQQETLKQSLGKGLNFVFKNQIVLGALSMDMLAVLFGGAVALLPVFAADILKVGPWGLGLMRAAPALGALIMAFSLTQRPIKNHAGLKLFAAVTCFGLAIIIFGLSKNFFLSLAMLFLSGMFDNVSVVIRGTIIQTMVPDNMRGRVASVNGMFIGSSNELGAFESGVAAAILGVVPAVIFGGTMTLVVVATTAWFAPKLRKLNL